MYITATNLLHQCWCCTQNGGQSSIHSSQWLPSQLSDKDGYII